jgi:hypothetical protein
VAERDTTLEVRFMVECVVRLRQLVYGQRCIICTREITPERLASLTLFDMSVCIDPACGAVAHDMPIHKLHDIDEEGTAVSEGLYRILRFNSPQRQAPQRVYHAVQRGAISALCGKRPLGSNTWFSIEGQVVTCSMCLACLKRRQRTT